MRKRAMEGTCLAQLVELAMPICQQAEQACPRRGPGRKPEIPDWQMAVLIMVAVAKRKKSKSAQYRFLVEHRALLTRLLDTDRFPGRSTYFDRYRRAHTLFTAAVKLHGAKAIRYGWASAEVVAVDKSCIAARGSPWHRRGGRSCRRSRGVDQQAGWGRSQHDGWVYGYGYNVVVSCGKNGVLWPLLASTDAANHSESLSFGKQIPDLPRQTRYVLADRGYDADDHCETIEWTDPCRRTGKRFLCPTRKSSRGPRQKPRKDSRERIRRRAHREARKAYLQTKKGQALYARRGQTVEPFNAWFKTLFELEDRVWHRGLDNNRTQVAAGLLIYQLLLRINRRQGNNNRQIKWILDAL